MPTLFDLRKQLEIKTRKDVPKAEVARRIRANKVRYGDLESGKAEPTLAEARKLAEYYGLSLDEISQAIEHTRQETEQPAKTT